MMTERDFNKIILRYFNDMRGIPRSVGEVSEYVRLRIRRPCEAQCERALEYLVASKYIERCEATAADEPLFKITQSGMRQAARRVAQKELDPMIWEDAG